MDRKEQMICLWKKCFGDTDEYLRLFFKHLYRDENALWLEKDGQIVTLLQMLPYTMTWCGRDVPVSYIYAACTDPAEQGRGWMHRLLEKAHAIMRARGFYLSVLIPAGDALFEFYRKQGYIEAFDYSLSACTLWEVEARPGMPQSCEYRCTLLREEEAAGWYPFFDSCLRRRKTCVLHSREAFGMLVADHLLEGGSIFTLSNTSNGHPLGMAFASANSTEAVVEELLAVDDTAENLLLGEIMRRFGVARIVCRKPPTQPDSRRMGMVKLLDREGMIGKWLTYHPTSLHTKVTLMSMEEKELVTLLLGYENREACMSLMPG